MWWAMITWDIAVLDSSIILFRFYLFYLPYGQICVLSCAIMVQISVAFAMNHPIYMATCHRFLGWRLWMWWLGGFDGPARTLLTFSILGTKDMARRFGGFLYLRVVFLWCLKCICHLMRCSMLRDKTRAPPSWWQAQTISLFLDWHGKDKVGLHCVCFPFLYFQLPVFKTESSHPPGNFFLFFLSSYSCLLVQSPGAPASVALTRDSGVTLLFLLTWRAHSAHAMTLRPLH